MGLHIVYIIYLYPIFAQNNNNDNERKKEKERVILGTKVNNFYHKLNKHFSTL